MSSLRRDLFERRLWPIAMILLAAVVAVPMLLLKSAPAAGTPTSLPPRLSLPAVTTQTTASAPSNAPSAVRVKALVASIPRDPFASGMPKLSSTPASSTASGASSATTAASATTTTASSTTTSTVAMVSPSPATSSSSSGSSSNTTASSTSTTSTVTAAPTSTTVPTSTTASQSSTPVAQQATDQSWTVYSVSLRFGRNTDATLQSNVARLTPLPSIKQPEVMFMGVMSGGKQAVFQLGAGVEKHVGPGLCRPDHAQCAAIVLQAGETETITIATANGGSRQLMLRLVRIDSSVTHSQSTALAAYDRYSAAGLCELALAQPVQYSASKGIMYSIAKAACGDRTDTVPFPYPAVIGK